MYFCLTVALIATFLWVNMLFAEYVNASTTHYSVTEDDKKIENARAKLRVTLVIIMGFFWSAVICFW